MSKIIKGDCIEKMKELKENSIDSIVTDPPYGISFMDSDWDKFTPKQYQDFCETWGKEAIRILKPGGYIISFSACRRYHRMVTGLEDAGFVIKDTLMFLFGNGFPKTFNISKGIDKHLFKEWLNDNPEIKDKYNEELDNAESKEEKDNIKYKYKEKGGFKREIISVDDTKGNIGYENKDYSYEDNIRYKTEPATDEAKEWEGWGTALKPSYEPILLAQKPYEKTYSENVLKHGVGGLNIDGCRIEHDEPVKKTDRKEGQGNTWNGDNTGLRDNPGDLASPSQKGRFPANIIIDPQSAEMLDRQSGESKSTGGTPQNLESQTAPTNFKGSIGPNTGGLGDEGGASRFFYSAKAHKSERNARLEDLESKDGSLDGQIPEDVKNDIATLKPINLMRYLCRLVTPEGGRVLDPFAGSGTTGCACEIEGFDYILIEKRKRFAEVIAPKRIDYWSNPKNWDELKEHEELPSGQDMKKNKINSKLSDFKK